MTKTKKRLNAVKSQTPSLYHLPWIFLERSWGHIFWFWAARNEVFAFKKKSQPIEPKYQVEKDVAFANPETLLPRIGAPWRVMRSQGTPSFFFTRKTSIPSVSNFVVLGILMNHFLRWQVQLGNQVQHAEKRNSCLKKWRATKRKQLISFNSVLKICIEPQWWFLKHRDSPQPIWIKRTNRETPTWKENWRGKSLAKPRGRKTWRSCFNHAGCKAGL